jgi:hypothetical protein
MAKKKTPRVSLPKGRKPFVVCVSEWFDRSPDTWFVDLRKLDPQDPAQLAYRELILEGLTHQIQDGRVATEEHSKLLGDAEDWPTQSDLKHAQAALPCVVQGSVLIYYPS